MSGNRRDASVGSTWGGNDEKAASSGDGGRGKATSAACSTEADSKPASAVISDARGDDNKDEVDCEPTLALASAKSALDGSANSPHVKKHVTVSGGNEEEEKEYFCGLGPWHPPWLQWLRDARVFTFLLCLFSAVEGALVSGLTAVVVSTIERRYRLSSTATGALASMNDVAVIISVIFISYFGERSHKPRWLGVGLIIAAIGAFIFALPQFVFGRYEVGDSGFKDVESCRDRKDFSSDCSSSNNAALVFFMIGNILIGVGAAPLFTIGTSYLDKIVNPKYVSIHLGVFYMTAVLGPALAFVLGGLFLSVYVDPSVDTHLEPNDPGWVGAWWLCYIVCGTLCLIIAVPFFFYPRLLPNSKEIRLLREQEMAKKGKAMSEPSDRLSVIKNFPKEVKKVVTNLSWLFITLGLSVTSVVGSGFASFEVKYTQNQFGISPSAASLITGATALPTGAAGVIASGLLIYVFKIKGRSVPLLGVGTSLLIFLTTFVFLIYCPTPDLAGVVVPYADGSVDIPDTSVFHTNCTASCDCTSSVFEPVCGADNVVYFSPCQAGCPPNDNETGYEQCSCIADQLFSINASQVYSDILDYNSTAGDGLCSENCQLKLALYMVITAFALFLVFMLQVPTIIITIRCVAEDQRTLALGLQSSIVRLIGFVPGPILFGLMFDSACLFWQHDCGRRGNCWVYDNTALSTRVMVLVFAATMCYIVFLTLCWLVYPRQTIAEKKGNNIKEDCNEETSDLKLVTAESGSSFQTDSSLKESVVETQT